MQHLASVAEVVVDREAYDAARIALSERQDRELYELRLQHIHERLQLLHRHGAHETRLGDFCRRQITEFTRKYQSRRNRRNAA